MVKISDYDKFDYNYKNYWNTRQYEDKAEKYVLNTFLKDIGGEFFVDIGGSFGRNLEMYYEKYSTPIVLDYSIKTLQKNKGFILKKYPNAKLIAANAYKMPFKRESIDASMIVRVLHHLEDQEGVFKEIHRITTKNGYFVLEYANKMHIKAMLKWILTLKLKNFSVEPYQQPNQENFEGTKQGQTAIFLNYHPRYIKRLMQKHEFLILNKRNCSFLRMNVFKKNFSLKLMLNIEKFLQKFASWTNAAPSIILKTQKKGERLDTKKGLKLQDILCCPNCNEDLDIQKHVAECKMCKKTFKKDSEIWDFRV